MFGHARRWRGVAALGVILAAVQAPVSGAETLWTTAANLVCRILDYHASLPPLATDREVDWEQYVVGPILPACRQQQPPPIFLWEKKTAQFIQGDDLKSSHQRSQHATLSHQPLFFTGNFDATRADIPDPVLPERKDMLPDTERTQLLIDFGVIPDASQLLSWPHCREASR